MLVGSVAGHEDGLDVLMALPVLRVWHGKQEVSSAEPDKTQCHYPHSKARFVRAKSILTCKAQVTLLVSLG